MTMTVLYGNIEAFLLFNWIEKIERGKELNLQFLSSLCCLENMPAQFEMGEDHARANKKCVNPNVSYKRYQKFMNKTLILTVVLMMMVVAMVEGGGCGSSGGGWSQKYVVMVAKTMVVERGGGGPEGDGGSDGGGVVVGWCVVAAAAVAARNTWLVDWARTLVIIGIRTHGNLAIDTKDLKDTAL